MSNQKNGARRSPIGSAKAPDMARSLTSDRPERQIDANWRQISQLLAANLYLDRYVFQIPPIIGAFSE
jgi:hypothetical protein